MHMFWILIIALGGAWVLQSVLSFKQTQSYTRHFVAMRRKGRVAIGKFRGGIAQGSIVMFVLDGEDRIVEGHRINGVTVVARFKEFSLYNGQRMDEINPHDASRFGRSVVKAVLNAGDNYRIITRGGEAAEPPTALGRVLDKLPGNRKPKKAMQINLPPVAASPRATTPDQARPTNVAPSKWRRRVPTGAA